MKDFDSWPFGRLLYTTLLCPPFLISTVQALPEGAQVQQGQVTITEQVQQMVIQQASDRAVIDYDSFSIGAAERVQIQQPDAQSILLNRVRSGGPLSEIHGQLQANGQVFLVNSAGILVGEGAQIDVGGLLLTTHAIDEHEFLAGQFKMSRVREPAVIQIDGSIQVDPGSFVVVVAPNIDLGGDIVAQFGQVAMVAADGASVLLQPGQWPDIQVTQATYDAWIHHHGYIDAVGGLVQLTAASASDLIDRVIFHEGTTDVSTTTLVERDGRVFIERSLDGVPGSSPTEVVADVELDALPGQRVEISTHDTQGYVDLGGTLSASGDLDQGDISVEAQGIIIQGDARVLNNGVQGDGGETRIIGNYLRVDEGAHLEVKGGEVGDGGFIELSGRIDIDIFGTVDLSAPGGAPGHLLIDPRNIIINNSAQTSITTSAGDDPVLSPNADSATVNAGTVLAALATGDVTVTTADAGGTLQSGTLELAVDLDLNSLNGNTLTLRADDILSINADIEDKGPDDADGNVNIVLIATRDIEMGVGSRIDAGTGTITVNSSEADFIVTELVSAASDTTAVNIDVGGSVFDNNDELDNIILTGGNAILSMQAGSNIDVLEGLVPIFSAIALDVKGFSQTQAGNLQISRVESLQSPSAGFNASTVDGNITVRGTLAESAPGIRVGRDGRLRLDAGGDGSNILIDDNMSTEDGAILLVADTGGITMGEANSITSTDGAFTLTSRDTQTIGLLTTGSTSDAAISLEVTGGENIEDAHDASIDTLNLQASGGGLSLVNVDNFVGLETDVDRFSNSGFNVSQVVLNELDDITVTGFVGTNTSLSLVAGGEASIGDIETGGTVSIQANRISEFYVNDADRIAKENVASIGAPRIELLANSGIGDVGNDDLSVVDYLDVSTTSLSVELLNEVTSDGVNEIAVQQVASQTVGDLVVSDIITPDETGGSARVFLASLNNGVDVSGATIQVDNNDVLGFEIARAAGIAPVEILLPALATVQSWALNGLVLLASATGTSVATNETIGGSTPLDTLNTGIDQLVWSSNKSQTVAFSGRKLDLRTSSGDWAVTASGGVDLEDLNGDGVAFATDNGNLSLVANGTLNLSDTISAVDLVGDDLRSGLIDLATNAGNIIVGLTDVIIRSTNTVDSDVETGLGEEPRSQTAVRIAQNNPVGTANIDIGSATSSVLIEAQGGDIYIAAGATAVTRDIEERTLNLYEDTVVDSFNQSSDPRLASSPVVSLDEVNIIETGPASASVVGSEDRRITLSSVNIAGFNLSPEEEGAAETAVDDVIQPDAEVEDPVQVISDEESDSQTRINVMLETVVPSCESGENIGNSSQCMKKQGFKEFLRSLVIGRGFPDKYKGLP